jgi:hypothetical protein
MARESGGVTSGAETAFLPERNICLVLGYGSLSKYRGHVDLISRTTPEHRIPKKFLCRLGGGAGCVLVLLPH